MSDWQAPLVRPPFSGIDNVTNAAAGLDGSMVFSGVLFNQGGTTWPANNLGLLYPVIIETGVTLRGIGTMIGLVNGSSWDAGIYDWEGRWLASNGGTAQGTTSTFQTLAFTTATYFPPGLYWLAQSVNSTTGQWQTGGTVGGVQVLRSCGILEAATVYPLPTTTISLSTVTTRTVYTYLFAYERATI